MTSRQNYLRLLTKKKKILILFFFISFIFIIIRNTSYAESIYPIARVNKSLITNIDLIYELEMVKIQYNQINNLEQLQSLAIKNLIELEIKKKETKNIILFEEDIKNSNQQQLIFYNLLKKSNPQLYNKKNFKDKIKEKIDTNYKWLRLIRNIYFYEVSINLAEIDEISKKNDLKKKGKENLISLEKQKKFNKFSISHLNKIKKNYIIKYYEK